MEFGIIIPKKSQQRYFLWMIVTVSITSTESQTTIQTRLAQNPTTADILSDDSQCDNKSKFFDYSTHSKLDCHTSYTRQYCNVTDDKEWGCLLQMADMQDTESCACKRSSAAAGSPKISRKYYNNHYCMHVEFCVFMETNWKCNPDFKCIKSIQGQSGIECSDGSQVFFPSCSRHLLYCKSDILQNCFPPELQATMTTILAEECLSSQFEGHDILFLIEKSHISNEKYNYTLKAINKNGKDVTSEYCRIPKQDWKYILATIVIILVLSLLGYGFYRFKRQQKAQDRIWDGRMTRTADQCNVVLAISQVQESSNTVHEQCQEILPQECASATDEVGHKVEMSCDKTTNQTGERNGLASGASQLSSAQTDSVTAFKTVGRNNETEGLRIGSFDNATYSCGVTSSGSTNYDDDLIFGPGTTTGHPDPPYANFPRPLEGFADENSGSTSDKSASSNEALLHDDTFPPPPSSDGYWSKKGAVNRNTPVHSTSDSTSTLLVPSDNPGHNPSTQSDGYTVKKSLEM